MSEKEQEMEEVQKACVPILEYLKKKNPYTIVVVKLDSVEVVQTSMRVCNEIID